MLQWTAGANRLRIVSIPRCSNHLERLFGTNAADHSSDSETVSENSPNLDQTPSEPADEPRDSRTVLDSLLRSTLLAEEAAVKLFKGQAHAVGNRPDVAAYTAEEEELLQKVKQHVVSDDGHTVRPSALSPLTLVGFFALGTAAGILPPKASKAILAGVQSALTDQYNEQLRELRETGLADSEPALRKVLRELRDRERAPEGAPEVPDITAIAAAALGRDNNTKDEESGGEISPEEGLAAVVSAATTAWLNLSRKV